MSRDEATLSRLLHTLSSGHYHSGDELGQRLGISRAAVWKQLQKLSELGIELESVRGRGYRLLGGLELLEPDRLWEQLGDQTRAQLTELEVLSVTDSTNSQAMQRAALGQGGYVCLAEQQTAGRGRRGRTWVSPFARNLYLSLSWGFEGGAAQLEGLSLAVGVAMCQVLESEGVGAVGLKWPNDLLWKQRKLAGVLLEMTGDPAGACQVVVGVGLNLAMPDQPARDIEQPWADLETVCASERCPVPGRNVLAARLIDALVALLSGYHREGFAAWREAWLARDAFAGRRVVVSSGARAQEGIARGVDVSGALLLEQDGERVLCHGGELSMRAAS
ncbi:BirA family biotin operon repressor/biotin-[acetyl-CoA-carboxylase] ligase [Marinimicrobium koreense]|uniref:Bifunctional ligase/repressor BirA n=1 Tax=Marinimicrobium koreense TaxID=306545 RepID=A0A3N1NM09_9GAMM|nr:bifunctional biotin--[acetyl-CoA-carboxylase] ligase/biotin operon repressor BirA [Marinimicrobium koreense]ROQ17143.1 BirA family biotin operon repressor/biotin-[acetyl-CoA-carboxylase] ligase [Marinimicrobium koreense]